MKTVGTNIKLRVLLTDIRDRKLIPRPEFQRRLVWSDKHKNAFIDTVLQGLPFPEIYVAAGDVDLTTGEGNQMLVDGQQRISTLNEYFIGSQDLKLSRTTLPYVKLSNEAKSNFLDYDVVARDLGQVSIEQIIKVFERINSTRYALNAMEVHNARYDGEFKKFAEDLAECWFFERHRTFGAQDIRRMNDLVFVLTLSITLLSTYFNRDDELENYLRQYNDDFPARDILYEEISSVFSFVEDCSFDEKLRVWKKADLFTLLVEIHRHLVRDKFRMHPAHVGKKLTEFYESVDAPSSQDRSEEPSAAERYRIDTIQATNDRSSRMRRGKIISDVIVSALNQ